MATFKDTSGREWVVSIPNFGEVKRLREKGLDLNAINNSTATWLEFLVGDAEEFLGKVWLLLAGQHAITFDAFLEAVDAATLEAIRDTMVEAIACFFHRRRGPELKERIIATLLNPIRSGLNDSDGSSPVSAG